MTEKKYIRTLKKRRDWLSKRITEGDKYGKDLTYDKQELSALNWVLERIENINAEDCREHSQENNRAA